MGEEFRGSPFKGSLGKLDMTAHNQLPREHKLLWNDQTESVHQRRIKRQLSLYAEPQIDKSRPPPILSALQSAEPGSLNSTPINVQTYRPPAAAQGPVPNFTWKRFPWQLYETYPAHITPYVDYFIRLTKDKVTLPLDSRDSQARLNKQAGRVMALMSQTDRIKFKQWISASSNLPLSNPRDLYM